MALRRRSKDGRGKRSRAAATEARRRDESARGLAGLSEAQLRSEVLVPLFVATGYQEVTERHSTRELGKDIVMWQADALMTRVNIAVVAKRGAISGRADGGQSTAATTATQIRQAFGADYPDPRTGQPQAISRVIVVASGSISEQAQQSITASLERHHRVATQYIDGVALAALVEKYLGGTGALAKAAALRAALKELEAPFDLKVLVSEDTVSVIVGPKPDAASAPLEGQLVLNTEGSPQADETRALLATHIRTGAPVTFADAQVHIPQLDEVLKRLGFERPPSARVSLSARRGREVTLLFRFRKDGEERALGPIRCQTTQVGVEEITIESLSRARGWGLKCKLVPRTRSLTFNLDCQFEGLSATAHHEALLLTSLLSRGSELVLEEHERGLVLGRDILIEGMVRPPNPGWVMLVGAIAYIEQSKGVALPLPRRAIEPAEAAVAFEVEKLLRGEVIEGTWNSASWKASGLTEESLTEFGKGEVNALTVRQTMRLDLFGQRIPLGVRDTTLYLPTITKPAMRAAKAALKAGQEHIPITIRPRKAPGRVTAVLIEKVVEESDNA